MQASRIFALALTMRWASDGAAVRKARAISSVVRPHTSRKVNATQLGNPICPYINIEVDPAMIGGAWYLVTPKGKFGSQGY